MIVTDSLVGIKMTFFKEHNTYKVENIYRRLVNGVPVEIVIQFGMAFTLHASISSVKYALEHVYLNQIGDIWEKHSPAAWTLLYCLDSSFTPKDIAAPQDFWVKYAAR